MIGGGRAPPPGSSLVSAPVCHPARSGQTVGLRHARRAWRGCAWLQSRRESRGAFDLRSAGWPICTWSGRRNGRLFSRTKELAGLCHAPTRRCGVWKGLKEAKLSHYYFLNVRSLSQGAGSSPRTSVQAQGLPRSRAAHRRISIISPWEMNRAGESVRRKWTRRTILVSVQRATSIAGRSSTDPPIHRAVHRPVRLWRRMWDVCPATTGDLPNPRPVMVRSGMTPGSPRLTGLDPTVVSPAAI